MASAPSTTAPSPTTNPGHETNYTAPLVVLTSLFFMWGFITCLNDILIPHLKALFDLNYTQVMLIQFTFFTAYFVMSLPSGWIVERVGYQRGIVIGLVTVGVGCLLFFPAAGSGRTRSSSARSSSWPRASRCCRWRRTRMSPSSASRRPRRAA